MKQPNGGLPPLRRCPCGQVVHTHDFRNRMSFDEFRLSGLCQSCQDAFFLGTSDEDPDASFPIRHGAVGACVIRRTELLEVCFVPFVFVSCDPCPIWEVRHIVRTGPGLAPLDPWRELAPMQTELAEHQIRILELGSFDSPKLREHLSALELLVGLDRPALDVLHAACPLPDGISLAGLREEAPWSEAFGRELLPLETWSPDGRASGSLLHACALTGVVLSTRGRQGRRPFDYLLDARAHRFGPYQRPRPQDEPT